MALPDDLPTSVISFGRYLDGEGSPDYVGVKGRLIPVDPETLTPVDLLHIESGDVITTTGITVEIGTDPTTASSPVPRSGSGLLYPDDFFWAMWWSGWGDSPPNRIFALPLDAEDEIDFDRLVPAVSRPAIHVPVVAMASSVEAAEDAAEAAAASAASVSTAVATSAALAAAAQEAADEAATLAAAAQAAADASADAAAGAATVEQLATQVALALDVLRNDFQPKGPSVSDLTYPLIVGHRGAGNLFPENTMAGYEGAVNLGLQAVEAGDMQLLADGGLVSIHDGTADRTTNGVGNMSAFTTPGVRTLAVDASVWFGGRWADQPVPLGSDIFDRLGGKAVLFPEIKATGATETAAVIAAVKARGLADSVVIQSFNFTDVSTVAAAGISAMLLDSFGTGKTPAQVAAAGIDFVGVNIDNANLAAIVPGFHAAGIKVLCYTVDQQADYDKAIAGGADGIFSNDPLYAARKYASYRRTTTPWTTDGTFSHGMLVNPGTGPLTAAQRGSFRGVAGAWRWALSAASYLVGPISPVANAAGSYTITTKLAFDVPPASNRTRWGGLYFGVTSDVVPAGDTATGYLWAARWDGQILVYGQPSGSTGMVQKASINGSNIVNPTLSAGLTAGVAITALPVAAVASALKAGHQFLLPTGQVATLSGATTAGATSLPITSLVPSAAVANGAGLVQLVTITVAKTPTGFTVSRTDDGVSQAFVDSVWAGGYVYLRNSNASDPVAQVSALSVTVS